MAKQFTVVSNVNIPKVMLAINNDKFWTFTATEWWRLYEQYVPYDTGNLYRSVDIKPGKIHHKANYAEDVYKTNKHYKRSFHALATSEWDKHALATQGPKLVKSMQNYIDRGNLFR